MNNYIYKITNIVNNKSYIGYTEDPTARWEAHRHNQGSKLVFQAIKKYSLENLSFEVIAEDTLENEDRYIQKYNTMAPNGYNLTEGGSKPPNHKGKSYADIYGDNAEEQRKKRHIKQLERGGYGPVKHKEESKKKISEAVSGKKNPMYGRHHSDSSKQKMSQSLKGLQVGEKNPNASTWKLTDPQGIEYIIQGTLKSFCQEQNLPYATVRKSYELSRPMRNKWKIEKL